MHLEVQKYRRYRRLTQRELAELSGLSQSYIAQIESNKYHKTPTLTTLLQIGGALKICPVLLIRHDCNSCFLNVKNDVKCEEFLKSEMSNRLKLLK